jgi:osmotically-inducible protein OsmY
MPDRPGRRKAVFADAASRHDAVRQNMGEPVTDEDRDTASERPKVDSESRKGGDKEPTAAERRAQALRDNLRRRKAQSRARSAARDGESPPET